MRTIIASFACAIALGACSQTTSTVEDEAATPVEQCGRDCALQVANEVLASPALAGENARATQNGEILTPDRSWLAGATDISIHGEYADNTGRQAMIVGTGHGPDGRPGVFGLRVGLTEGTPTEYELLVAHDGEASLFPTATPITRDALFDEIVPEPQRTAPDKMVELAQTYFDGIEQNTGAALAVTEDCDRIENGMQTTHNPRFGNLGCNSLEAFAYIPEVRERRYPIIDVERGVVVGIIAFYIPGGDYTRQVGGETVERHYDPRGLFLFEAFKIVDGKVRKIEATMRNVELGASLNWPLEN